MAVIRRTDSVDVEACPGSGKTTLLVAKLAILARRWKWSRSGMCVLSHTNAARDEIVNRLSASPEGAALLQYPHFIGTIHGFANEFLAIPYLRSKNNPITMIDTDVALSRRWAKVPRATKIFLDRKNNGDGRAFLRYSRDDFGGGKMSTLGEHTPTYAVVRAICEESSRQGYFCYDELFIWAGKLLDEQPTAATSLRARFPMLFIDEVQDNDESQSSLLHRVFMQGADPCRRQRLGDSNQAIYQSAAVTAGATTDTFPGAVRADLPNSFRFGGIIANIADPLGLTPQGLVGLGSGPHHPPTILLFNDGSVRSVLPEYGSLLRRASRNRNYQRASSPQSRGCTTAAKMTEYRDGWGTTRQPTTRISQVERLIPRPLASSLWPAIAKLNAPDFPNPSPALSRKACWSCCAEPTMICRR